MSTTEQLSEYELKRLERIRKNEAYLESLGLKQQKSQLLAQTQKTKRNQKRAKKQHVKPGEERRSSRFQKDGKKSNLVMLSYHDPDDAATPTAIKQPDYFTGNEVVTPSPNHLHFDGETASAGRPSASFRSVSRISLNRDDFLLTQQEKEILSRNTMDSNYLEKFEEFLVYHNKISDANRRKVMQQVTKLASGQGVRYESPVYGWKPDQFFQKGVPVTPLSDFVELMELARDCENKWGRDHGNGWLLSHPLKKMLLFQQFCLQNPDFLTSDCKLKDYYEQDDYDDEEEEEMEQAVPVVSELNSEDETSPAKVDGESGSSNKRPREDYTGRRVAKKFGRKVYQGTVQKYTEPTKVWYVVYDDGDDEEMEEVELQEAMELFDNPPKRGRPLKKARKN